MYSAPSDDPFTFDMSVRVSVNQVEAARLTSVMELPAMSIQRLLRDMLEHGACAHVGNVDILQGDSGILWRSFLTEATHMLVVMGAVVFEWSSNDDVEYKHVPFTIHGVYGRDYYLLTNAMLRQKRRMAPFVVSRYLNHMTSSRPKLDFLDIDWNVYVLHPAVVFAPDVVTADLRSPMYTISRSMRHQAVMEKCNEEASIMLCQPMIVTETSDSSEGLGPAAAGAAMNRAQAQEANHIRRGEAHAKQTDALNTYSNEAIKLSRHLTIKVNKSIRHDDDDERRTEITFPPPLPYEIPSGRRLARQVEPQPPPHYVYQSQYWRDVVTATLGVPYQILTGDIRTYQHSAQRAPRADEHAELRVYARTLRAWEHIYETLLSQIWTHMLQEPTTVKYESRCRREIESDMARDTPSESSSAAT